jgi:3-hydroxyisobutyrate dehydrogenase-like beta-hydroxyacid dehydrogenase
MIVGWIGLGKLGLPIAEEIAKTHDVGTELETGSPALLVAEMLRERLVVFDHLEDL